MQVNWGFVVFFPQKLWAVRGPEVPMRLPRGAARQVFSLAGGGTYEYKRIYVFVYVQTPCIQGFIYTNNFQLKTFV